MHVHSHKYTHAHTQTCYTCTHIQMCTHKHKCTYVCPYNLYMYSHKYIHLNIHKFMQVHTNTNTYMYKHIITHMDTHKRTHVYSTFDYASCPTLYSFTWTNIFTFSNVTVKETLGLAGFQQQQLVGLGELIHVPSENITGRQSENKAAARPACPALAIGDNGQACLDDVLGVRRAGDKRTRRTDVCSPRHSVCPSSA